LESISLGNLLLAEDEEEPKTVDLAKRVHISDVIKPKAVLKGK